MTVIIKNQPTPSDHEVLTGEPRDPSTCKIRFGLLGLAAGGPRVGGSLRQLRLSSLRLAARERGRAGASPSKPTPESVAARLDVDERLLLFCIASGTDWTRAGITKDALRASLAAIAGSSQGR